MPLCRYVQLPVNVAMREAWEQAWQPLRAHAAAAAGAASQGDRCPPPPFLGQASFSISTHHFGTTGHEGTLA